VQKAETFGYAAGWKVGLVETLDDDLPSKPMLQCRRKGLLGKRPVPDGKVCGNLGDERESRRAP
jgi:hypothetical protein